jgi:thermitase
MKGSRDILLGFIVSLSGLLLLHALSQFRVEGSNRALIPAEPTQVAGVTEDPALALNWGLTTIHAPEAWNKAVRDHNVIVAVIDTGVDISHPDLRPNIWWNPGETGLDENGLSKATNGIDDDGNGLIDDVHGWNFANNSPEIMDDHGHGTHIAGIIAAKRLNGLGSSGVAPDVSLMVLKYYDPQGDGTQNLIATIRAIRYAVQMGAKIINYSGGGILRSQQEEEAMRWAAEKGVLVVAAAGNEGLNSDFFQFYPADYDLPNILSVTAVDRHLHLLKGSNFGKETVDIGAPGHNIYSTLPGGNYGFMSGTSQATAFVSGAAALLIAQEPDTSRPESTIARLLETGTLIESLRGRSRSGRLVNVEAAVGRMTVSPSLAQGDRSRNRQPAKEREWF